MAEFRYGLPSGCNKIGVGRLIDLFEWPKHM